MFSHFFSLQSEPHYVLDKHARSNGWGFFSSQKPRRESASQVDEFFEGNVIRESNSITALTSPLHTPCRSVRSCRESQQGEVGRSSVLGFAELNESPDLPGFFDNLTPPYQSPYPVKTEPLDCFPTGGQEFASLLDVSLPDQVIVKREPSVECGRQQSFQGVSSFQNTYMGHFAMSRLMMPLTPPSSEPGSDSVDSLSVRATPPPPYLTVSSNSGLVNGGLTTEVREGQQHSRSGAYNRRNNPELEKRRTHRCVFPGKNQILYQQHLSLMAPRNDSKSLLVPLSSSTLTPHRKLA